METIVMGFMLGSKFVANEPMDDFFKYVVISLGLSNWKPRRLNDGYRTESHEFGKRYRSNWMVQRTRRYRPHGYPPSVFQY